MVTSIRNAADLGTSIQNCLQHHRPFVVPSSCAWAPLAHRGFSSHSYTSNTGVYGQAETVLLIRTFINDRDARMNGLCGKQVSDEGCWAGKGR